jgi:hypothetical protein
MTDPESSPPLVCEYRAEHLDPAMRLYLAWAQDLYDEDKDEGMRMVMLYLAPIFAAARRQRLAEGRWLA